MAMGTRPLDMTLAAAAKLEFGPGSTVGTIDQQHIRSSVRDAGSRRFVDQGAGLEAFEAEARGEMMRPSCRHEVSQAPSTCRDCLETACPPAAVDVEAVDRGLPEDRRGIVSYVDETRPLSQEAHAGASGKEFDHPGGRALHPRPTAALSIGQNDIEYRAAPETPLLRLTELGSVLRR